MTQIRVLRLIEYTYDTIEKALEDRTHWTCAQGSWKPNPHTTIRSAVLDFTIEPNPTPESETSP